MVPDWALRAYLRLRVQDPERGDVPGWVLITIMTAGIVTVLWTFAGGALKDILSDALDSVTGPGSGGKGG